ncbi:MAG: MlaD family protein [Rhodospirillales bacterium]|nr:MlaD family protein [Rhodospirillales bacterium]
MRSSKINYVVVGFFVIAVATGFFILLVRLSGGSGATDAYYAVYRNVTGLDFGTQVLYEGYPIGQVEAVTPTPEGGGMRFRVDFTIQEGWQIPSDSFATVEAPGLLSAIVIAISEGQSATPLLPGDRIESREAENLFNIMSSVAQQINDIAVNDLRPLLATVNGTVATFGEILGDDGEALIAELSGLARDLSERVPLIVDDVEVLTEQLQQPAGELNRLFSPENRGTVEDTLAKAEDAADSFNSFAGEMRETRKRVDQVLDTLDNMLADNKLDVERAIIDLRHVVDSVARHIDALNQNMEGAARNMYEFSRQIRKNPGLLLGGTPPEDQAAGGN